MKFIQLHETISILPKTRGATTTKYEYAFNLNGGESINDVLEYEIINPELLKKVADNYENLCYQIMFKDVHGFERRSIIKNIRTESQEEDEAILLNGLDHISLNK